MLKDTYTLDEFKKLFSIADEATIEDLYLIFGNRDPIEDFPHYISKTERLYNRQYVKLLRDESVEYDAMVTDYMERLTTGTTSGTTSDTETGTSEMKRDGSDSTTLTHNTTNTHTGENSGTTTATGKTTTDEHGTDDTDTTRDTQGLSKSNPFSNTYNSQTGSFPSLNWDASDTQNETKETGSSNETTANNSETDTSSSTNDSGTESSTDKQTGTDSTSGTSSTTDKGTTSTSKTGSTNTTDRHTDRYSGRHGYSAPELLAKSRDYILGTDAFRWLVAKFDRCFEWGIGF